MQGQVEPLFTSFEGILRFSGTRYISCDSYHRFDGLRTADFRIETPLKRGHLTILGQIKYNGLRLPILKNLV